MMGLLSFQRDHEAGVTLIEMMIVLVVIGVATGAATLSLGALARDDRAEQEARRLAAVLGLAADEALIAGQSRQLVWDAQGYQLGTAPRHVVDPSVTLARADGGTDVLLLAGDTTTQAIDLVVKGRSGNWLVRFDGLVARATAEAVP